MTTRAELGLWAPTNETAQTIANALRAHWAEAKKVAVRSPFFKRSANWLESSRHHLAAASLPRAVLQPVRATSQATPASAATTDVAGMKRQA